MRFDRVRSIKICKDVLFKVMGYLKEKNSNGHPQWGTSQWMKGTSLGSLDTWRDNDK